MEHPCSQTGFSTTVTLSYTLLSETLPETAHPSPQPSSLEEKGSSTTLIKSADDNKLGGAANGTREDGEINEKGPGEFRKYGTGNNKMRFKAEECKKL